MILRSLELKSFGQFIDKSYEFRRGINIVVGPNEAGKSTMMESIPTILFGCKDKKRFRSWGKNIPCAAALLFENRHNNVRIERNIDTDHIELCQCDDMYHEQCNFAAVVPVGEHSSQRLEYQHYLQKFLGVSDELLFRSSFFVGQGDFPSNAVEITKQLRTLLSGFSRGDSRVVLQALQDDYLVITNENPWSEIKTSPRELELVREALGDLNAQQLQIQELKTQLQQTKQQIAIAEAQMDQDRNEYNAGIDYIAWIQRQWQQGQNKDVEQLECCDGDESAGNGNHVANDAGTSSLVEELQHLEKILSDAGIPVTIPEVLPKLLAEADDIRCKLVALQQEMVPLHKSRRKIILPSWRQRLAVSLLVTTLVAAGIYFYPEMQNMLLAGFSALMMTIWIWFTIGWRRKKGEQRVVDLQLAAIEQQRNEYRSCLRELDEEFEKFGLASSAIELVKMKKQLETHEHIFERLSELRLLLQPQDRQEKQHGQQDVCQVASVNNNADSMDEFAAVVDPDITVAATESTSQELNTHHLQPEDLPEAQKKLDQLQEVIRRSEVEILKLLRQAAVLEGRLVDADKLNVTEEQLRQRAVELEMQKTVLGCSYDVLNDAVTEFYQNNIGELERQAGEYLSMATMGKYHAIKITENYAVLVVKRGQRDEVQLEHLSRGTIDLVCLVIRLALTRFLTDDEYLPFFLDDNLVNLDTNRLLETVEALERLSKEHQIVMFTHDERLYKLASKRRWHIVSLGRQRAPQDGRKKEGAKSDGGQLSFL